MTPEEEVQTTSTQQTSVTSQPAGDDNNQYIQALNELKKNSVGRSEYEALKAENKKLLDSIVNGTEVALPPAESVSVDELRKKLADSEGMSNLDYVSNALKLRKALMESGEMDPFVPHGSQYNPTQLDYEKANRVAVVLQDCVDAAEGDPTIFRNELQKHMR